VVVLEDGQIIGDLTPAEFFSDTWLQRCNLITTLNRRNRSTPGDIVAEMEGVHVALEGNPILHGIDLAVRQAEMLAIMGPNGSGKTTAMLTLAGAIRPGRGKVSASGRMAYVFQDAKLQAVADTVRNELALGPKILRWPPERVEAFVQAGLTWSDIDPDSYPLDLHPSQARMLVIAACNTDASMIILDEPTVGLDSEGIRKLMDLVNDLLERGKAVIVITHDEEVARLANRILVIRDGLVAEERINPEVPLSSF
jgi:energy-coupling factor transporter ATP-binding protein EcfA2